MKTLILVSLATSLVIACQPAAAHHSFSGTYQTGKKISVTGVVSEFRFANPHVGVEFVVTNANGSTTNWVAEGQAALRYRRAGWTKETLKKGELVRITGDATRDGSPMISIDKIEVLNSTDNSVARLLNTDLGGTNPNAAQTKLPEKVLTLPLRLADGRPNFTAYWVNGSSEHAPAFPLNAAGKALQARFDPANDPQIFCDPPGVIRQAGMTPHPVKITQLTDRVVFDYEEYGGHREVFFAPQKGARKVKTLLGTSIARYDNDKLIIETSNLLSTLATPEGNILSDRTTTVETYSRVDDPKTGPALAIQMVITDPVYLSSPKTLNSIKPYSDNYEFTENDCRPPLRKRGATATAAVK